MKYESIIRAFCNEDWAILPTKYAEIAAFLEIKCAGGDIKFDAEYKRPIANVKGDLAVIPIHGTIVPRANMFSKTSGVISAEEIADMVRAATSDSGVGSLLLDINSGGGAVAMIREAAMSILEARAAGKKVVAIANHLAASAAYWLMAMADEKVITHSGQVGSIGIIAQHTDQSKADEQDGYKTTLITSSKYKAEGNQFEQLGDEARAEIQRRVDQIHATFVADIAKGYGISTAKVNADFGQGRVFGAEEAKERGMVTRIETKESVIARLTGAKAAADLARRRMAV